MCWWPTGLTLVRPRKPACAGSAKAETGCRATRNHASWIAPIRCRTIGEVSRNECPMGGEPARTQNSPRLGRAFIQDPHTVYRRLIAQAPAHRVEIWGEEQAWLVTRYAEARALLADPRLSKNWRGLTGFFPSDNHDPHTSL